MLSSEPTFEKKNEISESYSALLSQQAAEKKRDSAQLNGVYYQLFDLYNRDFSAQLTQLKANILLMIDDENQAAFVRLQRRKQTLQLAIEVYGCCRQSGQDPELTANATTLGTAIAAASRNLEQIEDMELLSRLAEKSIVLLLGTELPREEYICFDALTSKVARHHHQKMQAAAQAASEFKASLVRLLAAAVVIAACFIAPQIAIPCLSKSAGGILALIAMFTGIVTIDFALHVPIYQSYRKKSEAQAKACQWSKVSNAAANFFYRPSQRPDTCSKRSEESLSLSRA